jgi:hypothetical protein
METAMYGRHAKTATFPHLKSAIEAFHANTPVSLRSVLRGWQPSLRATAEFSSDGDG